MDGPRACLPSDDVEIVDLINGLFREGTDQDVRTDYPLVYDPAELHYRRVLKMDGKVVAHVPVAPREVVAGEDRFMMGLISATLTHPDYRRRGFATLCLRDCVRIMEDEEWPVSVLWTAEATFPFYQHSGWEAVGSQGWAYRLRNEELDRFKPGPFEVVRYGPTDERLLGAIMAIHDAEPYRIARSPAQYRALLSLPKTGSLLATNGGRVAAYLTYGHGTNKPGLIEAGGAIEGVETLVRHVLERRSYSDEVQVVTPLTPSALGRLLDAKAPESRRPIEEAMGIGFQMHRVNSLEKLLRQIQPYLIGKSDGVHGDVALVCSDSGESVGLSFHDGDVSISQDIFPEKVVLTRRQLTQLIFGPHPSARPVEIGGPAGGVLRNVFPYYFPIWELDHC